MYARTQRTPLALFGLGTIAFGFAGLVLTTKGLPIATLALTLIIVAMFVLLLSPRSAVFLLCLFRFGLDMAWESKVGGIGVLDVLGAGVPVATLVVYAMRRPQVLHMPMVRPILLWTASIWSLAGIYLLGGGDPMTTVENSLRFTSGVSVFFLVLAVIPNFESGLRLTAVWVIGAIPVIAVFFALGSNNAMNYHGVLRHRALFFDVVTPALVGSICLISCIMFFGIARLRRADPRLLAALAILGLVAARMIFLTFSNATAGITILSIVMLLLYRKRLLPIGLLLFVVAVLSQHPAVQQRWWREIAIASGDVDPIAFASGRPNRWKRHIGRFDNLPLTDKLIGVRGAWGNPESQPLQLMTDLGFVGGTLTLFFLVYVLFGLWRWIREETDPERKLFFSFVSACAVGSVAGWITMTMLCMINFQWWFFSCFGVAAIARQQTRDERAARSATQTSSR